MHCALLTGIPMPKRVGRQAYFCPCDNSASQSTMHFILFCTLYKEARSTFLAPLLRKIRPCTYIDGFKFLHTLATPDICTAVANCIKVLMAIRERYEQ